MFLAKWQIHDNADQQCKISGCCYCQTKRAAGTTFCDRYPRRYPQKENALPVWTCGTIPMSNQHSLRNAERRKSCAMGVQDGMRTLTKSDHCESKLNNVDPCDQNVRRLCMRSALLAASQLHRNLSNQKLIPVLKSKKRKNFKNHRQNTMISSGQLFPKRWPPNN